MTEMAVELDKQNEALRNFFSIRGKGDTTLLHYSKDELIELCCELTRLVALYTVYEQDLLDLLKEVDTEIREYVSSSQM